MFWETPILRMEHIGFSLYIYIYGGYIRGFAPALVCDVSLLGLPEIRQYNTVKYDTVWCNIK